MSDFANGSHSVLERWLLVLYVSRRQAALSSSDASCRTKLKVFEKGNPSFTAPGAYLPGSTYLVKRAKEIKSQRGLDSRKLEGMHVCRLHDLFRFGDTAWPTATCTARSFR